MGSPLVSFTSFVLL
jgi:hypothetical protein